MTLVEAELFAELGSVVELLVLADNWSGPAAPGVTTMVTEAVAPEATEGKLAVTTPALWPAVPPEEAFAETNVTFAGSVCEIDTLVAVLGPLFVTVKM